LEFTPKELTGFLLKSYGFLKKNSPGDKLLYAVITIVTLVFFTTTSILSFSIYVVAVVVIILVARLTERAPETRIRKGEAKLKRLDERGADRRKALAQQLGMDISIPEAHEGLLEKTIVNNHSSEPSKPGDMDKVTKVRRGKRDG